MKATWISVALILAIGAAAAGEAVQPAQPTAAPPSLDLAQRYGPYGIIAGLLSLLTWVFRRMFNHYGKHTYVLTRLVEILSDRPCIANDDRVSELRRIHLGRGELDDDGG